MKSILISLVTITLFSINSKAQGRPELTEEQQSCLESAIGKPGEEERPSHEDMKNAFSKCGIQAPNHQGRRQHHRPELTDEQKTCLEGKIGAPGQGSKPSRDEFETAFSECGIQKPSKQ